MSLLVILSITLTGGVLSLNLQQLEGLQELLTGLPGGVFPTCQIVLFSELVDFDTADNKCKNFNIGAGAEEGNLATVNDEDKNSDLKMLLEMAYPLKKQKGSKWGPTRWVWAGLRKTKNNHGISTDYNAQDWQWANGDNPKEFEKWLKGQPDQRSLSMGKEGCNKDECFQNQMRINHNGKWDDTFTFKKHPYACDYQGKYILSAQLKTWRDAKVACERAGLHLAKVRNPGEVNEITRAMSYFLGERNRKWKRWDTRNWVWIGGSDENEEKNWVWTDGEKVGWKFPWIKRAGGDNAKNVKNGIRMLTGQDALTVNRDGLFDDSFIEKKLYPFACQCPDT